MSDLVYREEGNRGDPTVLLVHGYPESSYMWRHAMSALAAEGFRAIAPDLAGCGDSPPHGRGTWEEHIEDLAGLYDELDLGRVVLVVHDWGCLIGLRWACEHPDAIAALVISSGGFFADARWHAMASAMRTEGEGEALMRGLDQVGFAAMMRGASPRLTEDAIAEYWKTLADDERRRAHLELYRSGDFEKLEPYEGCLAALGVPSLILWGARDVFAPVAGAYRLARELPGAELAVYDDAAHFVWEEQPERSTAALVEFVKRHVQVPAES